LPSDANGIKEWIAIHEAWFGFASGFLKGKRGRITYLAEQRSHLSPLTTAVFIP